MRTQLFAVAYDLSDDAERRKVDKILKGWGRRVQKSLFVVRTPRHGVKRLQAELQRLEPQSGTVLLFRLQDSANVLAVGGEYHDPDQEIAYVV